MYDNDIKAISVGKVSGDRIEGYVLPFEVLIASCLTVLFMTQLTLETYAALVIHKMRWLLLMEA